MLSDNPARFEPGVQLQVGPTPEQAVDMVIERTRPQARALLVHFAGVEDRTQAEALRGSLIFAPPTELPSLPDDAFWEQDLVGLAVVDTAGRRLGEVAGVRARAEQDLWEVATNRGLVLLPASKAIILSVDLAGGRVTVDPPPGLFL